MTFQTIAIVYFIVNGATVIMVFAGWCWMLIKDYYRKHNIK
jgi:hypothetical protein